MPAAIREAIGDVDAIRRIYLSSKRQDDVLPGPAEPDVDAIVRFLCEERQFSRERVLDALARAFTKRLF